MAKKVSWAIGLPVVVVLCTNVGCSSKSEGSNPGNCGDSGAISQAGASNSGTLKPFASPADPGPNGIWFTASGEVLALGGYPFPPAASPGAVAFVDGWEMRFDELLVTVDHIKLSGNPDANPGDQSQTGGLVAQVDGPWAIDLHKGGPLAGKGGSDEQAVPIAALTGQNRNGCAPFDLSQRYAFGFDVVAATADAMNVNLDAQGLADYAEMTSKGYSVLYVGTATFRGTNCIPANAVFDKLPTTVQFRLGFKSPTSYINCQNPDYGSTGAFTGEEYPRGIYAYANMTAIGQVTIHTDHPFWDGLEHDSPMHFDQIAARYVGASGTPTATVEDFVGVDYTAFTDNQNNPLPWRNCLSDPFTFKPPDAGTMHFNAEGQPIADYAAYMTYDQRTQGHLNSDGLCFVKPH